jgi:hypothetical protein
MSEVALTRPELTMPEAEGAALRAAYQAAEVILEYGSGGSTVMASEMPGKQVFAVESDAAWARMMDDWFAHAEPAPGTSVEVIWADIGRTKEWGYPATDEGWQRYAHYPLAVWDRPGFRQPDVILVDGRFRTGCAMAAALRSKRPVTVLVDDYPKRKQYHRIEKFIGAPELTGRLARFEVTPMPVPAENLLEIIAMMTRP